MKCVAHTLYSFLSCRSEVNSLNFLSEAAVQNLHSTDKKKALRSINTQPIGFKQTNISPQSKPVKQHAKGNSDYDKNKSINSNFSALATSIQRYNWNLPVKKQRIKYKTYFLLQRNAEYFTNLNLNQLWITWNLYHNFLRVKFQCQLKGWW